MQIREYVEGKRAQDKARKELERAAANEIERVKLATKIMSASMESGDFAQYTDWKRAAENAEQKAFALREKLAAFPMVSKDEVAAAWNEHNKEHNQEFEKKLKAYEKARKALCGQYIELLEMQRDALELREDVADLMYEACPECRADYTEDLTIRRLMMDYSKFGLDEPAMLPLPESGISVKINGHLTAPEATYFIAHGDLPRSRLSGISTVALQRQPCTKAYAEYGPDLGGLGLRYPIF